MSIGFGTIVDISDLIINSPIVCGVESRLMVGKPHLQ